MKIEVGMYVRYKKIISYEIKINKIKEIKIYNDKMTNYKDQLIYIAEDGEWVHPNTIIKASHNIIDLIQEGDYVNGKEVTGVFKHVIYLYVGAVSTCTITNEEIKSILTKEQFKANEYEVE